MTKVLHALVVALICSFASFARAQPLVHDRFIPIVVGQALTTSDGIWGYAFPGSGRAFALEGETGRPGIVRLRTSNATGSTIRLFMAPSGWESGAHPNAVRFDDVTSYVWTARIVDNSSVAVVMSLNNQISFAAVAGVNNVGFFYDTNVNNSLRCMTTNNGSQTITEVTMPTQGVFHEFEVLSVLGQVDFVIDGVIVATHTTDLPSGYALTPYAAIFARANAYRYLDLDEYELN